MTVTKEITLKAIPENLSQIIDFVTRAANEAGLSEDDVFHCQLAVDEAATNVIDHAYPMNEKGEIRVSCIIRSASLVIEIRDKGILFDPASVTTPVISKDPALLEVGGLGLTILQRVVDEVNYSREEGVNLLRLVKRRSGLPPESDTESIEIHTIDQIFIITPVGRMPSTQATIFEERINEIFDVEKRGLIIDLSRLTYISSRGLKVFVTTWRQMTEMGEALVLSGPTLKIRSIFETTGLDSIFTILPDLETATAFIDQYENQDG